jgi:hypothetical protein
MATIAGQGAQSAGQNSRVSCACVPRHFLQPAGRKVTCGAPAASPKDDQFEPWVQPAHMMSRDATRLLRTRCIWLWVRRHSVLGANVLIALLTASADAARAEDRDIVLPELPEASNDAER